MEVCVKSQVLFERKTDDPARETLVRLLAGIAVIGIIIEIIFLLACQERMAYTIGLLLGIGVSVFNAVYIYRSLDRVLEMDEKASVKAMRSSVLMRFCLMGTAFTIGLIFPQICAPLAVICGLFAMKLSAYFQTLFIKSDPNVQPLPEEEWEEEEESQWGFGVFHFSKRK